MTHPAAIFAWTDRAELLDFVAARAFLTIVASLPERVAIAPAPAIVDGDRLLLHLSRGNPIVHALAHGPVRVVAVTCRRTGTPSPTTSRRGATSPSSSRACSRSPTSRCCAILARQSAVFEATLPDKVPWTLAELPPELLAAKLEGIAGATFALEAIRGTRKLSQNKSVADRAGVVAALGAHPIAALYDQ